ncbi:MAG: hypothetical protein EOO28_31400 [Comamonadaceae bacterium]|nr:MAG: hypothetical protein EOO28_31400 [Comamonadaceae bacterium]
MRIHLTSALAAGVCLSCGVVLAQTPNDLVQAQATYNRTVTACNTANLPAPQREACVRDAGAALDRARGGPPTPVQATSTDGRATVMTPQVTVSPGSAIQTPPTDVRTSTDGRATIVLPADAVPASAPQ